MIEIEKRVLLTKQQYSRLYRFLKKEGKLKRNFKRFTLVMSDRQDFIASKKSKLDVRIRTTKDGGKLAVKYGNWHASSREEYEIDFNTQQTEEMVNILRTLGFYFFVMTYIKRFEFEYEGFNITLDKYYSSDTALMEVEVVSENKKGIKEIEANIDSFIKDQGLTSLNSKEMVAYIQGLNNIVNWRVDFTKTKVSTWFKKWKDYIYCVK